MNISIWKKNIIKWIHSISWCNYNTTGNITKVLHYCSNNPTFTTGSLGEFKQVTFIGDPKVYITTIGLYNDRQELLAVAKLSRPVIKSFVNECVIKCKLDW